MVQTNENRRSFGRSHDKSGRKTLEANVPAKRVDPSTTRKSFADRYDGKMPARLAPMPGKL